MASHHVFVYGSLKKGFGNHRVLKMNDGVLLSDNVMIFGAKMYNVGAFPCITFSDNPSDVVHGELYVVNNNTLKALDMLEGYPDFYDRKQVYIYDEDNPAYQTEAWVYYWADEEQAEGLTQIKTGRW